MMFDPLITNKFSLRSRFVRSATAERIAMANESEGKVLGEKYAALARGGVGLIISGHITVHPSGRLHPLMAAIYTEENLSAWRRAVKLTHEAEGMVFLQLNHGGGRCRTSDEVNLPARLQRLERSDCGQAMLSTTGGLQSGPLCVSYLPERPNDAMLGCELTGTQIQELIKAFADAARNARAVGADGVQIHAAHGYLVSQFLSPLTNRRKDEWDGALEGRARFLRMVVRAVREAVGEKFPIGVKLGACDDDPAGLKMEETLQVAKWLATPKDWVEEDGIDFIEISGGFRSDLVRRRVSPGKNEGYYLPFAGRFKKELKIPVFAVGGLRSLEKMNEALSLNQCDAAAMSRPLICQPDLPEILRTAGKSGKSACRGCNLCLFKNDQPTACQKKWGSVLEF